MDKITPEVAFSPLTNLPDSTPEVTPEKDVARRLLKADLFNTGMAESAETVYGHQQTIANAAAEGTATTGEKLEAFRNVAYGASAFAKAINKSVMSSIGSGEVDAEFKKGNDFDFISSQLISNELIPNTYNIDLLQSATNKEDFDFYLQTIRTDNEWAKSSNILSSGQQIGAGAVGAIGTDPTYLAYAPVKLFQGLAGGVRLSAVMGSNAAIQYVASTYRDYGDPTRTLEDTLLDVAFGGGIETIFGMARLGKLDEARLIEIGEQHAKAVNLAASVQGLRQYTFDMSTNYNWSTKRVLDGEPPVRYEDLANAGGVKAPTQVDSFIETIQKQADEEVAPTGWRNPIAEFIEANKPTMKPKPKTKVSQAERQAEAAADVELYKTSKQKPLTKAMEKLGITQATLSKAYKELDSQVNELSEIIISMKGENPKAVLSQMKQLSSALDHVGALDKGAREFLEIQMKKNLGIEFEGGKLMTSADKAKVVKGRKTFEKNVKQITKAIDNSFKKFKSAFKDVESQKLLKPIEGKVATLSAKESKRLSTVQKKMEDLELKITKLEGAKNPNAASIEKALAEHSKLADEESGLLMKVDEFAKQRKKSVAYSLGKQKELYQRMASAMDELMDDISQQIKNVIDDSFETAAQKTKFLDELSVELGNKIGQEIRIVEKNGEYVAKGKMNFKIKGEHVTVGRSKLLVGTFLAAAASSAVMADDGMSIDGSDIPLGLILLGAGVLAYKFNALNAVMAGGKKAVTGIQGLAIFSSSKNGKSLAQARKEIVDKANFEVINSIQVIMNRGAATSRNLAQRLGFDAVNPQKVLNAMVAKAQATRHDIATFRLAEEKSFQLWLKELNLKETFKDKLLSGGAETELRERFLSEVTDFREFGRSASNSQYVAEVANTLKVGFVEIFTSATVNKIAGFAKEIENYIPRLPKYENIQSIIRNGGRQNLIEAMAVAMAKGHGKEVDEFMELAEKFVDGYANVSSRGMKSSSSVVDIMKAMDRLGLDTSGINADEVAALVKGNNDALSSGKFRVSMDFSTFQPFKVMMDGVEQQIDLAHIFERNAGTLLERQSSQVRGMVAIKKATTGLKLEDGTVLKEGFSSEMAIKQVIAKEPDSYAREVLETYTDSLLGHPLYDVGSEASKTVNAMRDLAYSRLALTQFSMFSEYATAVMHMFESSKTMSEGMNHFRNLIKGVIGKEKANTALSDEIADLTGMGSSTYRRENSIRNLDGMYNVVDEAGEGKLARAGHMTKYISLAFTRIIQADDALKRIAGIYNTEKLANVVNGVSKFSANRMERLGIDQEFIDMFKGKIILENGNLQSGFSKGWSQEMKDAYLNVMHRMIMTDSPEAILSSLPHMTATSDAGRLIGFMTAFAAQSYTTKALAGAKRGDMRSYLETLVYFMGTYAGVYSRGLATGKDETPEEIAYKTVMMMPFAAPYGVASMASDPMSASVIADSLGQIDKVRQELIFD